MVRPSWSRVIPLSAGVLLAICLAGCSIIGRAEGSTTRQQAGSGPGGGKRVSLVQKLGTDGPVRSLTVEPGGQWNCDDCAGDGVTSTGALSPDQAQRLQQMLLDPGLAKETDEARHYRQTCIDALTSTLLIPPGLTVTQQDCPGEERPPIAGEILLLLTQATPAEPTA
ncbi:hypothetical protein DLE60_15045 [Micromonospora globispora]|uniref:Uncharacterized protein n=1 Tax=Micromonospora globispora TaxID=1450148 RepID=A0A317KFU1_9ACTN|nr:hypothetical protein [Micromonospora globispora]PWU52409.1 hypothetical protein DLJ46_03080 [Micromonospora globispora]PWU59693.1 hypothetical protein DLE60_15045 [Micromonospora globispora]RQW99237.1 hypothetical protein DKL51_08820 [Micromonospora globispora]